VEEQRELKKTYKGRKGEKRKGKKRRMERKF
jgi:hypothetical protein